MKPGSPVSIGNVPRQSMFCVQWKWNISISMSVLSINAYNNDVVVSTENDFWPRNHFTNSQDFDRSLVLLFHLKLKFNSTCIKSFINNARLVTREKCNVKRTKDDNIIMNCWFSPDIRAAMLENTSQFRCSDYKNYEFPFQLHSNMADFWRKWNTSKANLPEKLRNGLFNKTCFPLCLVAANRKISYHKVCLKRKTVIHYLHA